MANFKNSLKTLKSRVDLSLALGLKQRKPLSSWTRHWIGKVNGQYYNLLNGQVTVPWPTIHVHALRSMRYHSILKIVDAEWNRWHQSSSLLLLSEAQSVLVIYCFQPSYMLPGLLPGSMRLTISCSYRAADNVLNVALLVLGSDEFPDHFFGRVRKIAKSCF